MDDQPDGNASTAESGDDPTEDAVVYLCDRCGFEMRQANCKITCPNCGARYDCSDLSIYFD